MNDIREIINIHPTVTPTSEASLDLLEKLIGRHIPDEEHLLAILSEIIMNIHDHADGEGIILFYKSPTQIKVTAFNMGSGDAGGAPSSIFEEIARYYLMHGSSKKDRDNKGEGLWHIIIHLEKLKEKHPTLVWTIRPKNNFQYEISYSYP
jgi:hypothetical protein